MQAAVGMKTVAAKSEYSSVKLQSAEADTGRHKPKIVEFAELSQKRATVNVAGKISLEQLKSYMPKTIEVFFEGESTATEIPVEWVCVGDYENSNYFYYEFDPVWDEDVYDTAIGARNRIPYIGVFIGADTTIKKASSDENREAIYEFMTKEMGFNTAAACGVLANIQMESSFRPTASVIDTNGLISYGICQWNGVRFEALQTFCAEQGYDYRTLEGQLHYLKYELEHSEASACSKVKNVENTAEGAYLAGYNWARYFERCASIYHESRAKLARDTYWPIYGGGKDRTKYSITYELYGGTNNSENPNSYYDTSGTISLKAPTRKGYIFGGWYKEKSFKTQVTSISGSDGTNFKLYAKWTPIRYTIQFNGNGATSGKMSDLKDCKFDEIYTLTANKYKKNGAKFQGWNTKKDGTGTAYDNKVNVMNLSKKNGKVIVLYAQWKKQKYTITYELAGGVQASGNPKTYSADSKTIQLKNPTKKGYTFQGWYSDSSYKTKVTKIKKGSTGNRTLYAKWKRNQYQVVFDGNGATSGVMKSGIVCQYGKSYTLVKNQFKKKNYIFAGWNTKANGSGKSFDDGDTIKNLASKNNKTITLYAQWARTAYTIQYELNGGIMIKDNPKQFFADSDTFQLNAPEREGYTFQGWYTDSGFKNKIVAVKKGTKKNLTLYAKWKVNQYKIQFDGNGADSGAMEAMSNCEYGEQYVLSENRFQKSGNSFLGWNTAADGSGVFYSDGAVVSNLSTENGAVVTLYAQWE